MGLAVAQAYALASRLALWAVTLVTLQMPHAREVLPRVRPDLWKLWGEWDGVWYRGIALHGYGWNPYDWAYFPLYPALVRLLWPLVQRNLAFAGVLVSFLASVGAFALLYERVAERDGPAAAERAVRYLVLFPTGFFLAMAYTEATFLVLALLALRWADRRRPLLAALAGMAAALTRSAGVCLAVPIAVSLWQSGSRRGVWAGAGPLVGLASFMAFSAWQAHDALAFVHAQYHWSRHLAWPWAAVSSAFEAILAGLHPWRNLADLATAIGFGVLLFVGSRGLRPADRVYGWLSWLLIVTAPAQPTVVSVFLSASRLALAIFPAFVVLARWGAHPVVDRGVTLFFPPLQTAAYILFSHSYFVA